MIVPFLADAGAREGGFAQTIIMVLVALFFFYFILWRPEQKRRKKMEAQRGSMKQGDRVTAMGIVGTVSEIKDATVVLTMVDGAKIEFLKHAITEVHAPEAAAIEPAEDKG
ncbi:MAG: preprotein translocase subunit YajC [Simkaniaceae bacterium]|nr:preprotein translocase subunit YajC [Simkaniaceae bacterium]